MADTLRLFTAVELPEEMRDELSGFCLVFRDLSGRISFVNPSAVHITVKFLGSVPCADIDRIEESMRGSVSSICPFCIRIKGVGVFPSGRFPRILWAGISDGSGMLREIYGRINQRLEAYGIKKEMRAYTPHITLARIKHIYDIKKFNANVSMYKDKDFGMVKADTISLVKSTLTSKGSVYNVLRRAYMRGKEEL